MRIPRFRHSVSFILVVAESVYAISPAFGGNSRAHRLSEKVNKLLKS